MEKSKRKSKNLLRRFMERFFFFPIDFVLQSTKSPDELSESFKTLAQQEGKDRLIVELTPAQNVWEFVLRREVFNSFGGKYHSEEKLSGRIHQTKSGITQLDGTFFHGVFAFYPFLMLLVFVLTYFNPSIRNLMVSTILFLMYCFLIYDFQKKRNRILELIETTL